MLPHQVISEAYACHPTYGVFGGGEVYAGGGSNRIEGDGRVGVADKGAGEVGHVVVEADREISRGVVHRHASDDGEEQVVAEAAAHQPEVVAPVRVGERAVLKHFSRLVIDGHAFSLGEFAEGLAGFGKDCCGFRTIVATCRREQ